MGGTRDGTLVKRGKQAYPERELIHANAKLVRPHDMASRQNLKDILRIRMQQQEHPATGGKRKGDD